MADITLAVRADGVSLLQASGYVVVTDCERPNEERRRKETYGLAGRVLARYHSNATVNHSKHIISLDSHPIARCVRDHTCSRTCSKCRALQCG